MNEQPDDYDRALMAARHYERQHKALIVRAVAGPIIDPSPLPIARCTRILARAAESERDAARDIYDPEPR